MTRPYRPSNGSEGDGFREAFCARCQKQKRCTILLRMMAFKVTDAKYPSQCVYDDAGSPTCTAFVPLGTPRPRHRTIVPAKAQRSLL
jgi:hypothetical protein